MHPTFCPPPRSAQVLVLLVSLTMFVGLCVSLNAAAPSGGTGTPVASQVLSAGYSGRFDTASESILNVHGDSWTVAWCENDLQYVVSDDSKNVDGSCVNPMDAKGYNVTFGQVTSSSPTSPLTGSALSCLPEYGIENETIASPTSSNSCRATWKAIGNVCLGSTLYLGISRHVYAWNGFGNTSDLCYADRQKAFDGSLIRSTDGGVHWSAYPGLDANGPGVQFPGSSFGTPSFIQYGKGMNDWLPLDGARDYVYAISNDGYWNNGNQLFLARASRSSDLLSKSNWEYLTNVSPLSWGPLPEVINSNASFETVTGAGTPLDWSVYGAARVVTNSSSAANQTHAGGHSLVMYGTSDGAYRRMALLTPGTTYFLSGYIRVTNTGETAMMGVRNYGGPELNAFSNSSDWDRKVIRFVPTGSSADIYCWKENGTQAAFCDDVQLTQQPPPAAVLEAPGHIGVTQIQYLPPSNGAPGLYLLPEWYYPDPNQICVTRWAFYIAEVPWGPWTKLKVGDDGPDTMEKEWSDCATRTKGYYNPTVVPKWMGEYNQASQEREVWLLYGGDFSSEVAYKPHRMRMLVTYPAGTANATGWVNLISKNSGKCLDVAGISTTPGALLQQWACYGGDNQKFQFTSVSGGYEITAKHSGLQLDIWGGPGATSDGAPLAQYPYWGGTNQIFQVNPTADGYYTINPVSSGKCLDVEGISKDDGAKVYQWACWGGDNQKWSFNPVQ